MIGVKPKKMKVSNAPDFSLSDGQAAIYGKVTERNIFDTSVTDAVGVQVTVYKNDTLVAYALTFEDGLYQIDSIDAGGNYTIEFIKDSVFVTPVFSLGSKEIKEVNAVLTTDTLF